MKLDIDIVLLKVERALSSVGLPAGPDHLINHKTILGLLMGAAGSVLGWLLSEPYHESFSFWRDFAILSSVGFCICLAIVSTDGIFERDGGKLLKTLGRTAAYACLIVLPTVLGTKALFTRNTEVVKVLLLDVSGSMRGRPIETLKNGVISYTNILTAKDPDKNVRIACVTFSSDVQVVSPPTRDFDSFVVHIKQMEASGSTRMADGLAKVKEILVSYNLIKEAGRGSSGNEVILVTDGKPDNGSESVLKGLSFFIAGAIPINTVGAGTDYEETFLERVSLKTGGNFVPADDISKLIPVMEDLARKGLTQTRTEQFSRLFGWCLIGMSIGACAALGRRSLRAIMFGIAGGAVGGLLGAVMFETVQYGFSFMGVNSGIVNRFAGFTILGACVGTAVPFAEAASKPAWIRIVKGVQVGRIITLDKASVVLGSGDDVDVRVQGDPQIDPKSLRFTLRGSETRVQSLGRAELVVNGQRKEETVLHHKDNFTVGITTFVYLNKLTGIKG